MGLTNNMATLADLDMQRSQKRATQDTAMLLVSLLDAQHETNRILVHLSGQIETLRAEAAERSNA